MDGTFFYAGDNWLWIAGQVALAALFIHRGVGAIFEFGMYVEQLTARGVPMPALMMAGGLVTMLTGGVLVAIDWHAFYGGVLLIVFTLLANHWFHHFWAMQGLMKKLHFYFFCNNISIIGGLLLVMSR
jgi:uncharacterized membrane protein YphA (DoxX/SURF4 family)